MIGARANSRLHQGTTMRIALYQPDIAGNTGTILRLAACIALEVHIIEPAGFDLSDRNLKRAGMDYLEMAALTRHVDWAAFETWRKGRGARLVLFTTKAETAYTVHAAADHRLTIPMQAGARSLNLAMSVAMVAGEALRQTGFTPR